MFAVLLGLLSIGGACAGGAAAGPAGPSGVSVTSTGQGVVQVSFTPNSSLVCVFASALDGQAYSPVGVTDPLPAASGQVSPLTVRSLPAGRWAVSVWSDPFACHWSMVDPVSPQAGVAVHPVTVPVHVPGQVSAAMSVDPDGAATFVVSADEPVAASRVWWRPAGSSQAWSSTAQVAGATVRVPSGGSMLDPLVAYDFRVAAYDDANQPGEVLLANRYPLPASPDVAGLGAVGERLGAVDLSWSNVGGGRTLIVCDGQVIARGELDPPFTITGAPGSVRSCQVAHFNASVGTWSALTQLVVPFRVRNPVPAPVIQCALWTVTGGGLPEIAVKVTRPADAPWIEGLDLLADRSATVTAAQGAGGLTYRDEVMYAGVEYDKPLSEDFVDDYYVHVWLYSPDGELYSAPVTARARPLPAGGSLRTLDDPSACSGTSSTDLANGTSWTGSGLGSRPPAGSDTTPAAAPVGGVVWAANRTVWLAGAKRLTVTASVHPTAASQVSAWWRKAGMRKWKRVSAWVAVPAGASQVSVSANIRSPGAVRWQLAAPSGKKVTSASVKASRVAVSAKRLSARKVSGTRVVSLQLSVKAGGPQQVQVLRRVGKRWRPVAVATVTPGVSQTVTVTVPSSTRKVKVTIPGASRIVKS